MMGYPDSCPRMSLSPDSWAPTLSASEAVHDAMLELVLHVANAASERPDAAAVAQQHCRRAVDPLDCYVNGESSEQENSTREQQPILEAGWTQKTPERRPKHHAQYRTRRLHL